MPKLSNTRDRKKSKKICEVYSSRHVRHQLSLRLQNSNESCQQENSKASEKVDVTKGKAKHKKKSKHKTKKS